MKFKFFNEIIHRKKNSEMSLSIKKFSNKIFYQKKVFLLKKNSKRILSKKAFAYIKNKNSLQKLFYKKKANKIKKILRVKTMLNLKNM